MNVAKIITIAGVGGALAMVTVLSPTTAASASSSRVPVAYELRADLAQHSVVRPGTFHLMVGGPFVKVVNMHWSHWNSSSARGTGRAISCDEGCSNIGQVTIVLHDPEQRGAGASRPAFEKLHLIGGRDILHHWHWDAHSPGGTGVNGWD